MNSWRAWSLTRPSSVSAPRKSPSSWPKVSSGSMTALLGGSSGKPRSMSTSRSTSSSLPACGASGSSSVSWAVAAVTAVAARPAARTPLRVTVATLARMRHSSPSPTLLTTHRHVSPPTTAPISTPHNPHPQHHPHHPRDAPTSPCPPDAPKPAPTRVSPRGPRPHRPHRQAEGPAPRGAPALAGPHVERAVRWRSPADPRTRRGQWLRRRLTRSPRVGQRAARSRLTRQYRYESSLYGPSMGTPR